MLKNIRNVLSNTVMLVIAIPLLIFASVYVTFVTICKFLDPRDEKQKWKDKE